MEYGVLGPLLVRDGDGHDLIIKGSRPRSLLLRLLADGDTFVGTDTLVEDLWDGRPTEGASQTVQSHVSRLRAVIGRDRIVSATHRGYRLVVDDLDDEIDAEQFERDADRGRTLLVEHPAAAARLLEATLTRWRGSAYADCADSQWARPLRARLAQREIAARTDLLRAWLALGDHDRVIVEGERLVARHPLDEEIWRLLMTALYRRGRQADALRTFERLRETLAEEVGLDPGPESIALERAILDQDPALLGGTTGTGDGRATPLPAGTVTFVASEVVGATRHWEREAEAMAEALDHHDDALRTVMAEHHGVVIRLRGEAGASLTAFGDAADAAQAVAALRRTLHAVDWPTSEPLSVRVAVHAGEAVERNGDYSGRTINRAAALLAVAEADRPLVSAAAARLMHADPGPPLSLVDLGMRRLRDIETPEIVFHLADDDLPPVDPPAHLTPAAGLDLALPPRLRPNPGFVGRRTERERLLELATEVRDGDQQLVLVDGEPGIGKSALAAELGAELHADGWLVLHGRCDDAVRAPYQPFVEALDLLVREVPHELVAMVGLAELAAVEPLLPSIRHRVPGLPNRPDTDAESDRLFVVQAATRLLLRLGEVRPVAFVIDDLHWADTGTVDVLRGLAQAPSGRVFVVMTHRHAEPAEGEHVVQAINELRTAPSTHRVLLGGLDHDDLAALAVGTLGTGESVSDAFVTDLESETDGNPFFAVELLRHLHASDALGRDDDGEWTVTADGIELPDTIREVVAGRVRRIDPDLASLLSVAAVAGQDFDLEVVERASDLDEDRFLTLLDQAEAAGLVRTIDADRSAFAHVLIANSLRQTLSEARRAALHRRVAEAIETLPPSARSNRELARHWLAARGADATERARVACETAGDEALAQLAPTEAVDWYRAALARTTDPTAAVGLRVRLGDALRQTGDPDYRGTLLEAARAARDLGLHDEVVRAARASFRGWAGGAGTIDEAQVEMIEWAVTAAGPEPTALRAELLAMLAGELSFSTDVDRRRRLCDEALAIAREAGDARVLARVLESRGNTLRFPETAFERDALSREHLAIAERLGDPVAHWAAVSDRLNAAIELADAAEVERMLTAEIEISAELPQPYQAWITTVHRSWHSFVHGRLEESEAFAGQGLEIGLASGQPDAFLFYGTQLFFLRESQGRVVELVRGMQRGLEENPGIPAFRSAVSLALARQGDRADAAALLARDAANDFADLPRDVVWSTSLCVYSDAAAVLRAEGPGRQLLDLLAPYTELIASDGAHVYKPVALASGVLAARLGLPEAPDLLALAVEIADRLDAPIWRARAFVALARLRDDRTLLDRALADVRHLGDTAVTVEATEPWD